MALPHMIGFIVLLICQSPRLIFAMTNGLILTGLYDFRHGFAWSRKSIARARLRKVPLDLWSSNSDIKK